MRAEDLVRDTEQRERTDDIVSRIEMLVGRLERQTNRLEAIARELQTEPGAPE